MGVVHRVNVVGDAVAVTVSPTGRVCVRQIIDTVAIRVGAIIRRPIAIDIHIRAIRNAVAISVRVTVIRIEIVGQPIVVAIRCVVDRIRVVINAVTIAVIAAGLIHIDRITDAVSVRIGAALINIRTIRNAITVGVPVGINRIEHIRQAVIVGISRAIAGIQRIAALSGFHQIRDAVTVAVSIEIVGHRIAIGIDRPFQAIQQGVIVTVCVQEIGDGVAIRVGGTLHAVGDAVTVAVGIQPVRNRVAIRVAGAFDGIRNPVIIIIGVGIVRRTVAVAVGEISIVIGISAGLQLYIIRHTVLICVKKRIGVIGIGSLRKLLGVVGDTVAIAVQVIRNVIGIGSRSLLHIIRNAISIRIRCSIHGDGKWPDRTGQVTAVGYGQSNGSVNTPVSEPRRTGERAGCAVHGQPGRQIGRAKGFRVVKVSVGDRGGVAVNSAFCRRCRRAVAKGRCMVHDIGKVHHARTGRGVICPVRCYKIV